MKSILKYITLLSVICIALYPAKTFAQEMVNEKALTIPDDSSTTPDDSPIYKKGTEKSKKVHIYETATLKNLAHAFLALNMIDINNDQNIDTFLRITECDIEKNYKTNEIEWGKIISATRQYILDNKDDFPVRFELVIPIHLEEYNEKKSTFNIVAKEKIHSSRLFELLSKDYYDSRICDRTDTILGDFSKGMVVELSRPFSLSEIPVERTMALKYIEEKNKKFLAAKEHLTDRENYSKNFLYSFREAYVVMYLRLFTFKETKYVDDKPIPLILGVLEGYDIYADLARKQLFASRNYLLKNETSKTPEDIAKEIEMLKKKSNEKGLLF